jgi:putative iron-regulated protein
MKKIHLFLALSTAVLSLSNCKKDPVTKPDPEVPVVNLNEAVLADLSVNVTQATYNDLADQSTQLYNAIQVFAGAPSDAGLTTCRNLWKSSRQAWEQSEGFLFGPVSTNNIDPHIDTWPVNYTDLDSVLSSPAVFSDSYIDGLEDALRGFHPIEYLLFGKGGAKTVTQFTTREKEYLVALAINLKKLTADVSQSWNPSLSNNYSIEFTKAGSGSTVYPTKRAAYEELVNAMAGICDEVANGKLEEPRIANNPELEESPFASNSIKDFTNNINSVANIYFGRYKKDGAGIEDIVRESNLALDKKMKEKMNAALASLNKFTVSFGYAIEHDQTLITNAQAAINDLKDVIEKDLMPYIQAQTN